MITQTLIRDIGQYGMTPVIVTKLCGIAAKLGVTLEMMINDPSSPHILRANITHPLIAEVIQSQAAPSEDAPEHRLFYQGQSNEEAMENSVALMEEFFVRTAADKSGMRIYRIVDRDKLLLSPIVRNDDEDVEISNTIKDRLIQANSIINLSRVRDVKNWWLGFGDPVEQPKLCAAPQEHVWCLHKITMEPDLNLLDQDDMGMPATMGFLDRLNDKEAFAAWMYGVYSGEYEGRQILWLQGEGSDGKSKFMKAFNEAVFGGTSGVGGVVQNSTLKNSPAFVASLFVDKRFVYVPDNSNRRLLMNEVFKSLADPGADPVVVNHKYGKMYTSEMEAHVAILSNHSPEITDEAWVKTRVLPIKIKPLPEGTVPDTRIEQKFKAEMPAFLAYGKLCYQDICQSNAIIEINEDTLQEMDDQVEDTYLPQQVVFDTYFVQDEEARMAPADVFKVLTIEAKMTQFDVEDFKVWLKASKGIEIKRRKGQMRAYEGIRRRMPTDSALREVISVGRSAR